MIDDRAARALEGFLLNEQADDIAHYLQAGRRLRDLPDEKVMDGWTQAFGVMVTAHRPTEIQQKVLRDFSSELNIRGLRLPVERVIPEVKELEQSRMEGIPMPDFRQKFSRFLEERARHH